MDDNGVEEAIERYMKSRDSFPTSTFKDTIPALKELSNKYLLGIITSKSKRFLQEDFNISRIPKELFFIVQAEEETKVHKPDPRVFSSVLKKIGEKGINTSEVVYVGDRLSDFFAAKNVGFQFYGILNGTTEKEEFEKQGAKTIKKISELVNL